MTEVFPAHRPNNALKWRCYSATAISTLLVFLELYFWAPCVINALVMVTNFTNERKCEYGCKPEVTLMKNLSVSGTVTAQISQLTSSLIYLLLLGCMRLLFQLTYMN